ncbi:integrase [Deltaproteobacteria bacterium]|nr:integrase [Deltaproteobacteria bacterium]
MPLTDTAIRAVKPSDKQQKLFDERGLFLLVAPTGSKIWRFKYRFQGKEKLISFGHYPDVSLKDAREKATEARKILGSGNDPSAERKAAKLQLANTFELVAREWHEKQAAAWSAHYAMRMLSNMEKNIFPHIGARPVADIKPSELLPVMRAMEARNAVTIAHTMRAACSGIFRYAVITGRAERDPAADIRGAITPHVTKNRAAITDPVEVGKLLLAIDKYRGTFVVRNSLRLMNLTFCRANEIRLAEWTEFDFEDKLWRIPAEKMKMSRDHLVPLSKQALAVLEEMRPFSGDGQYVFPGRKRGNTLLSINTFTDAIRYMGFTPDIMCAHGFRAMASTLLNEQGYPPDVIERQLAHVPGNKVRGAYNRAEYLPERRKMMDDWSVYLDSLRERARRDTWVA